MERIIKEREGEYLRKTVQIIPNVTDEIKERFRRRHEVNPEFTSKFEDQNPVFMEFISSFREP